jgi:hypothetical protein
VARKWRRVIYTYPGDFTRMEKALLGPCYAFINRRIAAFMITCRLNLHRFPGVFLYKLPIRSRICFPFRLRNIVKPLQTENTQPPKHKNNSANRQSVLLTLSPIETIVSLRSDGSSTRNHDTYWIDRYLS